MFSFPKILDPRRLKFQVWRVVGFLFQSFPLKISSFENSTPFWTPLKKFILIRISTFSIRYHKHSIIFEMTVLVLAENMCCEYVLRGQGISTIFDKTIKRTRNACTLDIFSQIRNYSKFDFNCSESSTYRMTQNLSCSLWKHQRTKIVWYKIRNLYCQCGFVPKNTFSLSLSSIYFVNPIVWKKCH